MRALPVVTDVLVVGGGPAGGAAAAALAALGRRVTVIEKDPSQRRRVCGEFVSAEALPMLATLGALAPLLAGGARPLTQAVFTAPPRRQLCFSLRSLGGFGPPLGVTRERLDTAVLAAAVARGAIVVHGARYLAPARDTQGMLAGAVVATAGGTTVIRASLLIGADGRASAVARSLGLEQPCGRPALCAFKAHVRPGEGMVDLTGVEIHLFPGGYVGMQPVEGGLVNVSAVVTERLAREIGGGAWEILREASARSLLARRRLAGATPVGGALSLFPLERRRRSVLGDRFLLVGDAAAVLPPFAGDGIAAGLRSGLLAAEAADAALALGDLSAAALRPYADARRRHLDRARRYSRLLETIAYRPRWAARVLPLLRGTRLPEALTRATRVS
jgi:2-polyprenyl-6-methoxyphenol hydroxylase-like FAD-dependent oxidoreductase